MGHTILIGRFPEELDIVFQRPGVKVQEVAIEDGPAPSQKYSPHMVVAAATAMLERHRDGGGTGWDYSRNIAQGIRTADGLVGIVVIVTCEERVIVLEACHATPLGGG